MVITVDISLQWLIPSLLPSLTFLRPLSTPSLDLALDLEIAVTELYTGSYFLEEIKGLADATGIDYKVRLSFLAFP